MNQTQNSAKGLYETLRANRDPYLRRARDCSALTIPSLLPREGSSGSNDFPTPYQSVGAKGVANVAAKLLLALFPPNSPFFKLVVDDAALEQLQSIPDARTEVEKSLSKTEQTVTKEFEVQALRPSIYEAIKHLVVAGNVLLKKQKGKLRVFTLPSYCVARDPAGDVAVIVTEELVAVETLPAELQQMLKTSLQLSSEDKKSYEKTVPVHTLVCRCGDNRYKTHQEIGGMLVPGSEGTYTDKTLPWIPLRLSAVSGESYGRSLVDEVYGDLKSLEGLSKAILEASAAMARLLILRNPAATTKLTEVNEAPNGAIINGLETDFSVLHIDKSLDLSVAQSQAASIEERLNSSFLLNRSVTRQAERVTAEEIRYVAQELEDTLGGIYSILGHELQLPLVRLMLSEMEGKVFPHLPKSIHPTVVAGLDALGRGHDLNKLDFFVSGPVQAVGPTALKYLNMGEYWRRRAVAIGIVADGLIKTEAEIANEQNADLAATMAEKATPNATSAIAAQAMATQSN